MDPLAAAESAQMIGQGLEVLFVLGLLYGLWRLFWAAFREDAEPVRTGWHGGRYDFEPGTYELDTRTAMPSLPVALSTDLWRDEPQASRRVNNDYEQDCA